MKQFLERFRLSRIRIKLFATVFAVLAVLLMMITVFATPMLFRTFTSRTYRELQNISESIDSLVPESASYYFDLYSIAANSNTSFEIIAIDGTLAYTSASGSALGSDHFASSGTTYSEYSSMRPTQARYRIPDYENFQVMKREATNSEFFVYSHLLKSGETVHLYSEVANVETVVSVAGGVYSFISITMILAVSLIFYLIVAKFTKPLVEMKRYNKGYGCFEFRAKMQRLRQG